MLKTFINEHNITFQSQGDLILHQVQKLFSQFIQVFQIFMVNQKEAFIADQTQNQFQLFSLFKSSLLHANQTSFNDPSVLRNYQIFTPFRNQVGRFFVDHSIKEDYDLKAIQQNAYQQQRQIFPLLSHFLFYFNLQLIQKCRHIVKKNFIEVAPNWCRKGCRFYIQILEFWNFIEVFKCGFDLSNHNIFSQKSKQKMPKRKIVEQDQSFNAPERITYRKYKDQTKLKYCLLVKIQGMKPSSAAKLLKIKQSTAKVILRTFKHPKLDEELHKLEKSQTEVKIEVLWEKEEQQQLLEPEIQDQMFFLLNYYVPVFVYPIPSNPQN